MLNTEDGTVLADRLANPAEPSTRLDTPVALAWLDGRNLGVATVQEPDAAKGAPFIVTFFRLAT